MRIFFWNYVRFSNWQYSFLPFRDLWIVGPTTNQKALLGPVWRLSQFENKTEQVVYGCPNKDTCFLNSTLRNTVQMMNAFSRVYLTFELKITIHIWCQTKLMKFLLKMKWIKKEQNHASSWTMPSPCWILMTKMLLSSSTCSIFSERYGTCIFIARFNPMVWPGFFNSELLNLSDGLNYTPYLGWIPWEILNLGI